MRVLHVHSGNLLGGVETFLLSLARFRALAPSMEMSVALSFDGPIAPALRQAGVPVWVLGDVRLSRPLSVWRARRAFASLLAQERPDVVVCHQAWPVAVFGADARRTAAPLVFWIHMAMTRHWLERLAWRVTPDLIVCNSRFTASTLPASPRRVEIVYAPVAGVTGASRTAGATGAQELVIVQVSRMEPLIGQPVLLEALAQLADRTGWVCWQVGGAQRPEEEQYFSSLRALAARLGIDERVRFLGHRTDVPELLAGAHIYCQPNVEPEAFGISLIEALAAGLPVVTSALGGALEIVDETCGVLVAPRDATALAVELGRLLDDRERRNRLASQGPTRARTLCEPGVQMPHIAEVLHRVRDGARSTV